jgi:Family of unknown function (DUF6586)
MSNPYQQRVNRQLMLARQHLEIEVSTDNASGRMRQAGLFESVLFHLYRAYLEMLRELADNYQLSYPDRITTIEQLVEAMNAAGKTSAETEELLDLQRQGFIADLLACWKHLFAGPAGEESEQKLRPVGLISTRQLQNWDLDKARLVQWLQSMTEISDRHRDIMVEY